MMTTILGISAFYHDSAATLLCDGEIVAAAQEERFTRRKHDPRFPFQAVQYVLSELDLRLSDVDHVAFYDKPFLKFERLLETYLATAPRGFSSFRKAMPVWLREKLFLKTVLAQELRKIDSHYDVSNLLFSEHHMSHAASAFYPSPFEEALVLTLDGVGEWATTTAAIGRGNKVDIVKEIHFPHSLGLLYSAFTYYLGFKVNSGEYKVMGLAPYGAPKYKDLILNTLVDVKTDGSFRLNMDYFNFASGLTMTNRKFANLFDHPVRDPEEAVLEQFHMDVAASVQAVTEEIVLRLTQGLAREYKIENLCMAGGVALNCVANGKVVRKGTFKDIWIQPAAGDAGGALGAAQAAWHGELGKPRTVDRSDQMKGAYLGPTYTDAQIVQELDRLCAVYTGPFSSAQTVHKAAHALADGLAIGWFQGRMEFGPRALGARSILGDPRSDSMQKTLNLKVKYRESFRPFAPSVPREDVSDWFELDHDSPYMLLVADVQENLRREMTSDEKDLFGINKLNIRRSSIPAVTHIDYSARIQTVHRDTNPIYHSLLKQFQSLTGCPVLVNTSFNVRGEPIVSTPKDAFRCFMGTDLDILVIGNLVLRKEDQDASLRSDYKDRFELD